MHCAARLVQRPDFPAGAPVEVTLKVAGIHWWYRTRSHAAELTAGYYNTAGRDGYNAMIEICAKHGAGLTLTCVEMCDAQHPAEALCGPEGLLRQVPPLRVMATCWRPLPVFKRMDVALPEGLQDARFWALEPICINLQCHSISQLAAACGYWRRMPVRPDG